MNQKWVADGVFQSKSGEEIHVIAEGPAPRIYEALGNAKEAIAKAFPSEPIDTFNFSNAMSAGETEEKEWQVTFVYTKEVHG